MLTRKLRVNVATYGANKIKEADLPAQAQQGIAEGYTLQNIKQFVQWAANKNNDPGFLGQVREREFVAVMQSGRAGATMRDLLLSALKTMDGYD